jgi:hypothetical protein
LIYKLEKLEANGGCVLDLFILSFFWSYLFMVNWGN